jgi:hypothetical protein
LDNPALYLSRLVEREVLGLPPAHFQRYLDFLERVPRLDLSGISRTPFDRTRAVLVVVGDPAVRAQLRSLHLPVREV